MIACLGWGSLIWDPKNLKINGDWQSNGPELSIEFARQSQDGRLTLVIEESAPGTSVLWAEMQYTKIADAAENLRNREETRALYIGCWSASEKSPLAIPNLSDWAEEIGAASVIWTALPPKFMGKNDISPTQDQALAYLNDLNDEQRKRAEEYIRCAPKQIATPYRHLFEMELGWTAY